MTANILKIKQLTSSATSHFSKQMVSMPVKTDYNTQVKTLQVCPEITTPRRNLPYGSVRASHVPYMAYHSTKYAVTDNVVTLSFTMSYSTQHAHTST